MNLIDNDYKPIDETEEYSLIEEREEEEEESVRSVAERFVLTLELILFLNLSVLPRNINAAEENDFSLALNSSQ